MSRLCGWRRHAGAALCLLGLWLALPGAAGALTMNSTTASVSPDGSRVYVGFNGVAFSVYARDANTGQLSLVGEAPGSPSGGGLFHPAIAVSPDGGNVYGVDGPTNALLQYGSSATGVSLKQTYPVLPDTTTAKDPLTLAVSPDGASVYVLTYGYGPPGPGVTSRGAITAYHRDGTTGDLSLVGTTVVDCCGGVIDPVVSPDGRFVYVSDAGSHGGVVVLSRDTTTGALTLLGTDGDLNGGNAIAISPDGNFVYEAGPPDQTSAAGSAISVLARNATTGRLTPVSRIQNGSGGVSAAGDMLGITVSGDGGCVYATSRTDSSLVTFTRNPGTGALSPAGVLTEGVGGVSALANARQVSVSADGKNVYVASAGDNGGGVFARDPATCAPSFVALVQDLFVLQQPVVDQVQGTATVPVDVETAGTIDLTVQALASGDAGRTAAAALGSHTVQVSGAGVVKLPVTLNAQAQQRLDTLHRLTVRAAVTFTATRGAPTTKTTLIQLVKTAHTGPTGPTTAQVRAALSRVLVPSRKAARIGTLLKNGGYRVVFAAPGAGRVTIGWYQLPKGAHLSKAKPKPVLVASVSAAFTKAGSRSLKIALTKKGRQLLKNAKRQRLTAKASFTVLRGASTTVIKGFTLRR